MTIKKLKSNIIWLTSARFIYALMQWLTVAIIARLDSTEMLGLYTYSIALITPLIIFSQMNMQTFVVTDALSKYTYSEYFTTRVIMTLILFICCIIYIIFFNKRTFLGWTLLLVLVFKSIESISNILNSFQQKTEKMSYVAISNILRGCLLFISILFSLYFFKSLLTGLIFVSITWLLVLVFFDLIKSSKLKLDLTKGADKVYLIIRECIPLGIISALVSVSLYMPSYIIKANYGYKEVGIFVSLMYFLQTGRLFIGSIVNAIAPKVSRICLGNKKSSIIQLALILFLLGLFFSVLFIVLISYFGTDIIRLVYGEDFVQYFNILLLIIYASIFGFINQFMGLLLTSMRTFKSMLLAQLIQVSTVVYVCVTYVPVYGLSAAAYSVIAGSVVLFTINSLTLYLRVKKINNNIIGII